ncbi:hypothetical protein ACU639_01935 [Streptomyces cynarae]|uniref:hypothetical protein n=1 Tax=Streptomyces cynarae TaxID=2981134 RepID=UPI00406C88BB
MRGSAAPRDSGQLREDFTSRDLVLLLMANAGVLGATADAAPDAWRRLVAWMIQSLQAPPRPAAEPAGRCGAVRGHAPRQQAAPEPGKRR